MIRTEPGGERAAIAPPPDDGHPSRPERPRRFVIRAGLGAIAAILVAVLVGHHSVARWLLAQGLGFALHERVALADDRIGRGSLDLIGVTVTTPNGDPLLSAARVRVRYTLRPLAARDVAIERAVLTLVHHADGSYNVASSAERSPVPAGGEAPDQSSTGVRLGLHLRDGTIRLVDQVPNDPDLAAQTLTDVNADAAIDTSAVSRATLRATYHGSLVAEGQPRAFPLRGTFRSDVGRGLALGTLRASALPVRGPLGFVLHTPAIRAQDGLVRNVAVRVFALDLGITSTPEWHYGGSADADGVRLGFSALHVPATGIRGRLVASDAGLLATRLTGRLAGVPIVARGGVYGWGAPQLRIGLAGNGDATNLRALFAFSAHAPVAGGAHVETLIEARAGEPLIRTSVGIARGRYGRFSLETLAGRVDYHAGSVLLDGITGRYGPVRLRVGGRFLLGQPLDTAVVLQGLAPGDRLPYGENVAPEATVDALAIIRGGLTGYHADGAIGTRGPLLAGGGTFRVDERGVGEFGPFAFTRADGSAVSGALRLDRPDSLAAAWVAARGYRIAVPRQAAHLPGLDLPAFPPLGGRFDAQLAGGGPPSSFALAGEVAGRDLQLGRLALGTGSARLAGTLRRVELREVAVAGPLGRFRGEAADAAGIFALRGAYDGSLERLRPLTGQADARGAVSGPVLAEFDGPRAVVQSTSARLRDGSIRGVALSAAAGTIAVDRGGFRLIAARGSIGDAAAVALQSRDRIAVSAPELPSAALRGTGLPLTRGRVSVYGLADVRGAEPAFDGRVAVAGGRAHGLAVAGEAGLALAGPRVSVRRATAALGSTYGSLDGGISGVGKGPLRYDLHARVPLGDARLAVRDLRLAVPRVGGSFSADLHIAGSGNRPRVTGRVSIAEGRIFGLAFARARAEVALDGTHLDVHDADVTVGSTRAGFSAALLPGSVAFGARAPAVDLADFNDLFDRGDTLAGRGQLAFSYRFAAGRLRTSAHVALTGLRIREATLGSVRGDWEMHGAAIVGRVGVVSPAGTIAAVGSLRPAVARDPVSALGASTVRVAATVTHAALGTLLPAAGIRAPVAGDVSGRVTAAGRYPNLALGIDATLTDGRVASYKLRTAELRATTLGTRLRIDALHADFDFGTLALSGRAGLAPRDPLALDLRVDTPDIRPLVAALAPAHAAPAGGVLTGMVHVGGTVRRPALAGTLDLRDGHYGALASPHAVAKVSLAGNVLTVRSADVTFGRGQADLSGSLPLRLNPLGLTAAPLAFALAAHGIALDQFTSLLPAGTTIDGTLDGNLAVAGTVRRPRLTGDISLGDASYRSTFEQIPIRQVTAALHFAGRRITVSTLRAQAGRGTLAGSGSIELASGILGLPSYDLTLRAAGAQFDFPTYGRGTLDGALTIRGGPSAPLISGDLALHDAVIPVSALYGGALAVANDSQSDAPVALASFDPRFDLVTTLGRKVRIRSGIVDVGVKGGVDVGGTLGAPQLDGTISATDGTISSYNHFFRVVNATATFTPDGGIVPTIDARATARVLNPDPDTERNIAGSANITVTVEGTPDNHLQVSYSSDPPYSQEQIVGLLLDVPGLLKAVSFNYNGGPDPTILRGAPPETNALLPPGVTPLQVSAISFNQEVFSLVNGQIAQRALSPVTEVFDRIFGLSDLELTADYGGGLGYAIRRPIGNANLSAYAAQTVTYPERENIGIEMNPKPYTTYTLSLYQQNGVTSLITSNTPGLPFSSGTVHSLTGLQPVGNRAGLSLNFSRRY